MESGIRVYGTAWCGLTFGIRKFLMQSHVDHDYLDIERDPDADEFVRGMHDGQRRYPIVVIGARVVTNPTLAELRTLLDGEPDVDSRFQEAAR